MRSLHPYLLGGGASGALVAGALAAFLSLAALVSEPSFSPPDVTGSDSGARREVAIDSGTGEDRAGKAAGDRRGDVPTLTIAPTGAFVDLLLPAPGADADSRGDRSRRRGDGRRPDGGRRGDGRRGDGRGGDDAASVPETPGPAGPRPPSQPPGEAASRGRALGHLEGRFAPPGHGGSPPGRERGSSSAGRGPPPAARAPSRVEAVKAPTKKNGKVPPGQAKKRR